MPFATARPVLLDAVGFKLVNEGGLAIAEWWQDTTSYAPQQPGTNLVACAHGPVAYWYPSSLAPSAGLNVLGIEALVLHQQPAVWNLWGYGLQDRGQRQSGLTRQNSAPPNHEAVKNKRFANLVYIRQKHTQKSSPNDRPPAGSVPRVRQQGRPPSRGN